MATHESQEMYLETIFILSKKHSILRAIDVGEHMGFSKPSVSRALGLLKNDGLITVDDAGIILTKKGEEKAKVIYERHLVLTKMFVALGVARDIASEDACRVEHYISDQTFEAIKKHFADITEME